MPRRSQQHRETQDRVNVVIDNQNSQWTQTLHAGLHERFFGLSARRETSDKTLDWRSELAASRPESTAAPAPYRRCSSRSSECRQSVELSSAWLNFESVRRFPKGIKKADVEEPRNEIPPHRLTVRPAPELIRMPFV